MRRGQINLQEIQHLREGGRGRPVRKGGGVPGIGNPEQRRFHMDHSPYAPHTAVFCDQVVFQDIPENGRQGIQVFQQGFAGFKRGNDAFFPDFFHGQALVVETEEIRVFGFGMRIETQVFHGGYSGHFRPVLLQFIFKRHHGQGEGFLAQNGGNGECDQQHCDEQCRNCFFHFLYSYSCYFFRSRVRTVFPGPVSRMPTASGMLSPGIICIIWITGRSFS